MQFKMSLNGLSLEFDGPENFFKGEIIQFIEAASKLAGPAPQVKGSTGSAGHSPSDTGPQIPAGAIPNHSSNTIAKLLDAKTGPDLIMAAVAKVIIVDKKDTANRSEIVGEMKKASSYYKKTYNNNLSKYLETLTKSDSLRLASENNYGLPAKMREQIEGKLHE